jgi:hypothetical protein
MLAVELSWQDKSADDQPLRSEAFKDAAAMELFRGANEPFLGMGAADAPVDIWYWDADRQGPLHTVEQANPRMVVDIYPFHEKNVESAELSRPGGKTAEQPEVSLPARAAGNQIVPADARSGGSSFQAGGLGTLTFRLPRNQLVEAHGTWKDGRWTVVMKRWLAFTSPNDGVSLAPGDRASVAFAVWDGGHRDLNGQKLITIWQDLQLEK